MEGLYPDLEATDTLLRDSIGEEDTFHPISSWAGDVYGQLQYYALQYHEAARDLVQKWLRAHYNAESFVFAIAFLYRQAIELSLKSLIVLYTPGFSQMPIKKRMKLIGERHGGHDLIRLWRRVRKVIPAEVFGEDYIDNVTRVIGELACIDATADGFRYPYRISGDFANLQIEELAKPLEYKSADNFIWVLEALMNSLDLIANAMEHHQEFLEEMAAGAGYETRDPS